MIIDELLAVLPTPALPLETGARAEWASVHDQVGLVLPNDYQNFIQRYGTGIINSWIRVYNPFSKNSHLNLIRQMIQSLSVMRELKSAHPEAIPYPLHFEPSGLLPWGISMDGDLFCWLTTGLGGHWKTVVICRHAEPELYPVSMSQFLARTISGSLTSRALPSDYRPTRGARFESSAEIDE